MLHRYFSRDEAVRKKKQDNYYNYFVYYSQNKKFNILFGLFTKQERTIFLEYIMEDAGIWFTK